MNNVPQSLRAWKAGRSFLCFQDTCFLKGLRPGLSGFLVDLRILLSKVDLTSDPQILPWTRHLPLDISVIFPLESKEHCGGCLSACPGA